MLLIGWGFVTTIVLISSIRTGEFPIAKSLPGLYISIAILGIIPIVIGMIILLRKRLFESKVEAPSEVEEKTEK